MKRPILFFAFALASSLLPACVDLGLAKEDPERLRYLLDVERPQSPEAVLAGLSDKVVLEVRSFHGSAAYIDNDFVYRRGALIEADYYHGFLTPPAVATSELARRWLGASGLFGVVQGVGTRLPPTHALQADIYAFYGDFADPDAPKAVIEIAFALVLTDGARLVARRTYREHIAIDSTSPEDLVSGWNRALAAVFTALEVDLRKGMAK